MEEGPGMEVITRGCAAEAVLVRAAKRGSAKAFAAALRRARASGDVGEAAVAEARQSFKRRQEDALQQLHHALPGA